LFVVFWKGTIADRDDGNHRRGCSRRVTAEFEAARTTPGIAALSGNAAIVLR